jgi:hypothetical protein
MGDFKILFSLCYYDHPLTGLSLWKGEKVYFNVASDTQRWWYRKPGCAGDDTTAEEPEWDPLTQDFTPEVVTFINTHLADDETQIQMGKISVLIGPEIIEIEEEISYDLYRLPHDILTAMEYNNVLFTQLLAEKAGEWYGKYNAQKIPYTLDLGQLEKIGHI